MRLQPELWEGLRDVCQRERWTERQLIDAAEAAFPDRPRTSAVRCYLLGYFRSAATEAGHIAAEHDKGATPDNS